MRFGRPRTLLSLILTGIALVALPLLIGIANAVLKLDQLTDESSAVVDAAALSTLHMQQLQRLRTGMERNLRQYKTLQDQRLLPLVHADAGLLLETLQTLQTLPQTEQTTNDIDELKAALAPVRDTLAAASLDASGASAQISPPALDAAIDGLAGMTAKANAVAEGMQALVSGRLEALQENTRSSQEGLAWQAAALIPGTLILILFFVVLVGRPMRQVDRAIRELGKGDFSNTITVTGPRDIETLGRQLEWLRHRLKESTDEKNKFLRHMSHELKTPLANIREGTELLLDGSVGKLDHQQEEVTAILRDNGIKLQKLIENLLTFSAWQTKTASLEFSEFELKPLVFSVLSQHRLVISNRKIKLHLKISPITIRADEGKVRLVLENLLSNAIKFTPDRGTIYIRAAMDGQSFVIDVADSGPGIAPEDGNRIFEAFYQGRRLQGGPVGGTGIGLSVVHECVQAHGGTVEIMSTNEFPGAHFQVRLPLRRVTDKPALVVNG